MKNILEPIIAKAVAKYAPGVLKSVVSQSSTFDMLNPINARGLDPAEIAQILEDALNGDLVQQAALFDIMEDTWDRLRLNMDKVKGSMLTTKFEIMPYAERGKEPSDNAQEKATFVQYVLDNFNAKPWKSENEYEDTIYDLMDAVGRGISVLEIFWRRSESGEFLIDYTKRVPATRYRLGNASNPEIKLDTLYLYPNGLGDTGHDFDEFPHKFLIGIYRTKSGNLAASGMLRSLAAFWVGKTFGWEWLLNRAQLFGIPIRWASYKEGASPKVVNDVCNMLLNMGSAGWGAFPQGTEMNLISADAKGVNDPNERLMAIADRACDIMLLGQTLTTDVGDSGSRAVADVHRDVELDKREAYARFVARMINNQLIPSLVELNYGNRDELPFMEPKISRPKNEKEMAERDKVLVFDMGLPVSKKWLYERHNIPIPAEDDDLFEPNSGAPAPVTPAQAKAIKAKGAIMAADRMLEELTGVSQQWLGPVKPIFHDLLTKAMDEGVSDEDLVKAIESAKSKMPEIFDDLNTKALADYMERVMGAEVINGAVEGSKRK